MRQATFQAVSIMTTTGMSASASIKVVRHLLLGKVIRREVDQTLSPEFVMPIRLNGSTVDERTVRAVAAFVLLYVGIWAIGAAVIAIESALSGLDWRRSTRSLPRRRPWETSVRRSV